MSNYDAVSQLSQWADESEANSETSGFAIEVSSAEVAHFTRQLIECLHSFCGIKSGKVVTWEVVEHNRGYGDMRRVSVSLVLAIPKQTHSTRIVRKKPAGAKAYVSGDSGSILNEATGVDGNVDEA